MKIRILITGFIRIRENYYLLSIVLLQFMFVFRSVNKEEEKPPKRRKNYNGCYLKCLECLTIVHSEDEEEKPGLDDLEVPDEGEMYTSRTDHCQELDDLHTELMFTNKPLHGNNNIDGKNRVSATKSWCNNSNGNTPLLNVQNKGLNVVKSVSTPVITRTPTVQRRTKKQRAKNANRNKRLSVRSYYSIDTAMDKSTLNLEG